MEYLQTTDELVTWLPITSSVAEKRVIYSIPLYNLTNNKILQITGQFEVTNTLKIPVMIGSNIILATSQSETEGIEVDNAVATNVTKEIHHGVIVKARQYKVTSALGMLYLNLVGWAMSYGQNPSDALKVEQHYGHLDVTISQL